MSIPNGSFEVECAGVAGELKSRWRIRPGYLRERKPPECVRGHRERLRRVPVALVEVLERELNSLPVVFEVQAPIALAGALRKGGRGKEHRRNGSVLECSRKYHGALGVKEFPMGEAGYSVSTTGLDRRFVYTIYADERFYRYWFGAIASARSSRFGTNAVKKSLELLEISPLLDRRAHQLTSGEVKRVETATAFARRLLLFLL